MVSAEQLQRLHIGPQWVDALNETFDRFGISTPRQQAAFAVRDVLPVEPLPTDSWHWDHPQVRVTAHCSNAGDGPPARGAARFVDNLRRYLAGEPLYNEAARSEVGL